MKKSVLIILIFFSALNVVAQEKSLDFIQTYEGSTGDNQGFYMKLKSFSGKIQGSMFMKNNCNPLTIEGVLKENRTIELKVSNASKNLIYTFSGISENNNKIQGNFNEYNNTNTFFALGTSENFDTVLLNCSKVLETKTLNTLVIDELILTTFPSTKSSGKAWDNSMENYKADIYFTLTNENNKEIYKMPNYYLDIDSKNPLQFKIENLKIDKSLFSGKLGINFYDYDSVSSDDYIGGAIMTMEKQVFNSEQITRPVNVKDILFTIKYHYE